MWPNPQFPADWPHLLKKSMMKNFTFFRQFWRFALHHESAESAEGHFSYLHEILFSKIMVNTMEKDFNGSECLVLEGRQNFCGFHDFHNFRGVDLAHFLSSVAHTTEYVFVYILWIKNRLVMKLSQLIEIATYNNFCKIFCTILGTKS